MIPFFRKLRKQLANDNKPLKYMRYAIGEIVLVVIGILIALQINTWNTERSNRKKEAMYLSRITKELKVDIQTFKEIKDDFANSVKGLNRIIKLWQSNNPIILDTVQYFKDYNYSSGKDPWYLEPVTWTQLQQTGDLNLITNKELTDELFIFYSKVKLTADNYLLNPMAVFNEARNISNTPLLLNDGGSYSGYEITNYINQKEGSYEGITDDDSTMNLPVKNIITNIWGNRYELLPIFQRSNTSIKYQILKFKEIIELGEQVLKKLEAVQTNTSEYETLKSN